MTDSSQEAETTRVARSARRATFASLLAGGIFFALLFIGLNAVVRSASLPETTKVMALITLAFGLLVFALALVGDFLARYRGWRWDSPLLIALWAYILPAVYFLVMCLAFTVTAEETWPALTRFGLLLTHRLPILLIWQVLMLVWFLLRVKRLDPRKAFTLHRDETVAACLTGLGLGLCAIFIISIESALFPSLQAITAGTAGAMPIAEVVFLVFSISLLPWAGEQYFRGILFDFLDNRLGGTGAIFLSSLLFSLLSFRLNLVLPGLLVGLGLALLRRRIRLEAAICAHAVCNLVILGLFNANAF
jgi:membrane protease YdiL (CAAX protease family)